MKLTAIILFIGCLQVSAHAYSQNINLSVKDMPLEKVFSEIKKQTGYDFFYDNTVLQDSKNVTLDIKNLNIDETLKLCLKDQPLDFRIINQTISIRRKEDKIQENKPPVEPPKLIDIKGIVTNDKGEPLAEASVFIKGTKNGTKTGKDGSFEMTHISTEAVLVISYTGYAKQEIRVGSKDFVSIILAVVANPLDAVQVIAYGTTTQRYNVGSVSTVKSEDIASQPVTNTLQALEGRVPGLVVSQTSGVPGAAVQIQIRGQNTLNPHGGIPPLDNPFFIIDGVPFAPQNSNINQFNSLAAPTSSHSLDFTFNSPYGGISPFSSINPADIESIEVLRDADATAIYGSRGSNGVILITTKKGKAGKAKFSANVWTGESQVTRSMQMMNTQQYLQMRREAINNDGLGAYLTPAYANSFPDLLLYDTTKYTDWKKYLLGGTAHTTDANISISGGNNNTQFRIGSGYHHETYIYPGGFADNKASFDANLHHVSTDQKLSLDFSTNYSYDQNNSSGSPNVLLALTLPPNYPMLKDENGNINWKYNGSDLSNNPLGYLKQKYLGQIYNLLGHFQISYQVLPGLSVRSSFGYNTLNAKEYSSVPLSSQNPAHNPVSYANFGSNDFQTWIIEPQAEFRKSIGRGKLNILIGSTFQQTTNSQEQINGSNYSNDALLGSISAAGSTVSTDAHNLYKYSAAFGRVNYIHDGKYIINLTGRRDGSSRFGPGKQFGDFGSVGGGWIFTEEQFFKKRLPAVSYGKLRLTYGTTGSDAIGDYQYLSNWAPVPDASFQGTSGYTPLNLFNSGYSWEVNKKLEAGLELGFFKDNLLFSSAWYRNRCGNQLITYTLPNQTGFSGVTANFPGLVQNTGWEFQIDAKIVKSSKISWTTNFNLTIPRNKLVSFPGLENSSYASQYEIGKSLSVIKGYKLLGVNDTTGIYQFITSKGEPTYSPSRENDYGVLGNRDPSFYGGLRNTVTLKGFQLDIFFAFSKQNGPNYLQQVYNNFPPGGAKNQPTAVLSRWQNPGDQTAIQKFTTRYSGNPAGDAATNYFTYSTGAYSDASYIRLKTLSLSYSLDPKYLKRSKIENCRIFINAQNLFTITSYKGNDPETMSFYSLPPLRTVVAGIQFTL